VPFNAVEATGAKKIEVHTLTAFSPAEDLSNKTASVWLYIDAAAPPSGTVALQICSSSQCANWNDGLPVGQWVKVTQPFNATNFTAVTALDVQVVWNNPTAGDTWSGTVYFDEVGWQ
jgi:hypothetical protein